MTLIAVPIVGPATGVHAAGAQLQIAAPAATVVGKAIPITLTLRGASGVSGYEAFAHFDQSAAEFGGLFPGQEDAPSSNVEAAIADEITNGTAFALYTCEASGCPSDHGDKREARRQLENVTLRVVPTRPGILAIDFDQLRFVDKKGRRLDVAVTGGHLSVAVQGSSAPIAAPAGDFQLSERPAVDPTANTTIPAGAAADKFDATDDGSVTFADAAELSMDWVDARTAGGPCQAPGASDVNGDGCVDVADLQAVAATANAPTTAAGRTATVAAAAQQFVVNSTTDLADASIGNGICAASDGKCSLRAALNESNAIAGANSVVFNIPGTGVQTIQLQAQLNVTDATGGVTIDGYTQPGAQPNTAPLASNAKIMIQIKGNGTSTAIGTFDGIRVVSAGNVFRGLAVYNALDQFELFGAGANSNRVVGDFIGTNATGGFHSIRGSVGGHGIHLEAGSHNNVFGTPALADRNVLSGAPYAGIRIDHEHSDANIVQNNIFGLTPSGTGKRPNGVTGIDLQFGASFNIVGGLGLNEHNVFSGQSYAGIDLSHSQSTSNNEIVGNFIGTTLAGNATTSYTKTFYGITFKDDIANNQVHDNVIGGATGYPIWHKHSYTGHNDIYNNRIGIARDGTALPNAKYGMFMQGHDFSVRNNIFANNPSGGILLSFDASDRDEFTGNTFINNGGLAIDLAPAGPTPNDPGDADAGPNQLLNYPNLTSASMTAVSGTTCASCRVEVYRSALDPGNRGEGNKLVGTATATAAGSFTAPISGVVAGNLVAAIAIDPVGDTSEFSTVLTVP